jgi:exopolyphosphatase/pppGpp-phosphohydrolase
MTSTQQPPIAAAIDIGSNSIKMTVGRQLPGDGFEQIDWASEVVRLGQGIDENGRLSDDRIEAAMKTLDRFAEHARGLGARELVAVATEATRVAENGLAFLDRVRRETGIDVRIVDGQEEAALTFRGLTTTADVSGNVVVADIGGGSTELIVAADGAMVSSLSIPLGSGRLTERQIRSDPPTLEELANSEREAEAAIESAAKAISLPVGDGVRLIVVGGTGEFMARLVPDEAAIDRDVARAVIGKMAVLTAAELADAIEAPEARARVLPAGVTIVAAIANRVSAERIEIARSGIRAGLLLQAFDRLAAAGKDNQREPSSVVEPQSTPKRSADKSAVDASALPAMTFAETLKKLIGERWQIVWKTIPAALAGTDIEGVHDVRVASRRLRAAMDIAAPVFPQRWFRALHRTAKEITGALGEVRDRDVLLEALRADRAAAPLAEHPGIDRLIERIDHERVAARAEMERYLAGLLNGPIGPDIERRFDVQLPSESDAHTGTGH